MRDQRWVFEPGPAVPINIDVISIDAVAAITDIFPIDAFAAFAGYLDSFDSVHVY